MNPAPKGQGSEGRIRASDLLARVAEELDTAARTSREVEALAARATGGRRTDPSVISGLQRLDLVTQTLADLARLIAVMAPDAGPVAHAVAPLAHHLRLRDLRARLFDGGVGTPARRMSDGGDVDLF